jgi:hypothetical protein
MEEIRAKTMFEKSKRKDFGSCALVVPSPGEEKRVIEEQWGNKIYQRGRR